MKRKPIRKRDTKDLPLSRGSVFRRLELRFLRKIERTIRVYIDIYILIQKYLF